MKKILAILFALACTIWADEGDKHPWYMNFDGNQVFSSYQLEEQLRLSIESIKRFVDKGGDLRLKDQPQNDRDGYKNGDLDHLHPALFLQHAGKPPCHVCFTAQKSSDPLSHFFHRLLLGCLLLLRFLRGAIP